MVNFYEKAIELVGELPPTANWIYLFTAKMITTNKNNIIAVNK